MDLNDFLKDYEGLKNIKEIMFDNDSIKWIIKFNDESENIEFETIDDIIQYLSSLN